MAKSIGTVVKEPFISDYHSQCFTSFTQLAAAIRNPKRDFGDHITMSEVTNEFDRYKIWAGNVGAMHKGPRYQISLDYRLSETSFFRQQVISFLKALDLNIQKGLHGLCVLHNEWQKTRANAILSALELVLDQRMPAEEVAHADFDDGHSSDGSSDDFSEHSFEDSPWEISNSEDDDDTRHQSAWGTHPVLGSPRKSIADIGERCDPISSIVRKPTMEMPHTLAEIHFTITCLYKLPLRHPAPLDRFSGKSEIDWSIYQHFDMLYVKDKFPLAKSNLTTNLGKLVTRRRVLLISRSAHDKRLMTTDLQSELNPNPSHGVTKQSAVGILPERGFETLMETTVAKAPESQMSGGQQTGLTRATKVRPEYERNVGTMSEYAPSMVSSYTSKSHVKVPDRPRDVDGKEREDFKCPYCFITCHIETPTRWKRHVLRDLQPYVCTFQSCELYEHMFDNRDDWFHHEMQAHRIEWGCGQDGHPQFGEQADFLAHMGTYHDAAVDKAQSTILLSMFERPKNTQSGTCSLCLRKAEHLKSHLAHHLEQIALFALPRENNFPEIDSCANVRGSAKNLSHKNSSDSGTEHHESRSAVSLEGTNENDTILDIRDDQVVDKLTIPDSEPLDSCFAWEKVYETVRPVETEEDRARLRAAFVQKAVPQAQIDKGADVSAQGREYGIALQVASRQGHDQVVQILLDKGDDVNARGGYYGNALQAASYGGHDQVVQLLLDRGADVNAQGGYYGNALQAASYGGYNQVVQAASYGGHDQVVQMLLDKGADVNAQGGYYGNALQAASYGGHDQVVQMLLDKGADVNAQNGYYGNALQAASYGGHDQVMQMLFDKGADINAQGGYYGNALQASIYEGHDQVVQMLLDKGADINAQGGYFGNALQAASTRGHDQVMQMLLDRGADINAQGGYYNNALQAASYEGHSQVVQMLLNKGADINAQSASFGNALQAASSQGHAQVVQMLLDKGVDINAQSGYFGNALQAASYGDHAQVMQMLLDRRADINAQGGAYGNALQAASSRGHDQVVQILLDKGADVDAQGGYYDNALQAASWEGHDKVVRLLLNHNAMINRKDLQGRTSIHLACAGGWMKVVKILLSFGSDLTSIDTQGRSCLHHAASKDSIEIVKWLLKEGFDPNYADRDGWTSLHWAAKNGSASIIEVLKDAGARSTIESIKGWTPDSVFIFHRNNPLLLSLENAKSELGAKRGNSSSAAVVELIDNERKISPGIWQDGYHCDGCLLEICGARYECSKCPDFNYCFKCKNSSDQTHLGHRFEKLE